MYHDVPKKKQACRSFVIWRYVKVYDRVTDGLESHRAFHFLATWVTFARTFTWTTSSTPIDYYIEDAFNYDETTTSQTCDSTRSTARQDVRPERIHIHTTSTNYTRHHAGEDRRPREDRKAAEVYLCRPPQLHVMDRCSAHVIPS